MIEGDRAQVRARVYLQTLMQTWYRSRSLQLHNSCTHANRLSWQTFQGDHAQVRALHILVNPIATCLTSSRSVVRFPGFSELDVRIAVGLSRYGFVPGTSGSGSRGKLRSTLSFSIYTPNGDFFFFFFPPYWTQGAYALLGKRCQSC